MEKSSRHSKITGDFGEYTVLYYLSKHSFEVSLVDHTGIDIVGYNKKTESRIGISVKSRSKTIDKKDGLLVGGDNYKKIEDACKFFGCDPWIAFVIDRLESEIEGEMYIYLMSVKTLLEYHPSFKNNDSFTFSMSEKSIQEYDKNEKISRQFQISIAQNFRFPATSNGVL